MIINQKLNLKLYLSITLLPILLVTGPFLPDLIISISVIFFFKYLKNLNFKSFLNIIFLIFISYITLRSIFTEPVLFSLKSSFFYFRFYLFSLIIYYCCLENKKFIEYFLLCLLLITTFLLLDGFYQAYFEKNLFNIEIHQTKRVSSLFGDELILGTYLSKFSPILLFSYLYFKDYKKKISYYFLFLFFLSFILVFFTGQRTSILYYFVVIVFYLLFTKDSLIKFKLFISLLLLIFFIIFFGTENIYKTRIFKTTILQMKEGSGLIPIMHADHYKTAYEMYKNNKIFGVGPNMFRKKCKEKQYNIYQWSCSSHPHNFLVQIMAETGIIGVLIYLTIFICMVVTFFKLFFIKGEKYKMSQILLLALILNFNPLVPNGNFFTNWLNIINYIPLGFFMYFYKLKQNVF